MERALTLDVVRRFPCGPTVSARASWPLGRDPVTVLFGPSGSGKTTVLRALAGLDRPDAGAITFGEERWFDAAAGVHLPPQRRGVGLVFQGDALFPHLTVAANVGFGLRRLNPGDVWQCPEVKSKQIPLQMLPDARPYHIREN